MGSGWCRTWPGGSGGLQAIERQNAQHADFPHLRSGPSEQAKPDPCQELAQVVAGTTEEGVDRVVATIPLRKLRPSRPSLFMWPSSGSTVSTAL